MNACIKGVTINIMILQKERQHHIDGVIELLTDRTGMRYPDDNLIDIARALEIEVYTKEFEGDDTKVNGVIDFQPDNGKKAKIYINESHAFNRKSFTLAHEIGHFLLHPQQGQKFRVDVVDYSNKDSAEETEANYFAASLLMPKNDFLKIIKISENTKDVAKYFGVSQSAVDNRILWLRSN